MRCSAALRLQWAALSPSSRPLTQPATQQEQVTAAQMSYSDEQHHERAESGWCFCSTGAGKENINHLKATGDCEY